MINTITILGTKYEWYDTIRDLDNVFAANNIRIHPDVIGTDCVVYPGVEVGMLTEIGPRCVLGTGAWIYNESRIGQDTFIGERCQVGGYTVIGSNCMIWPYVRIGDSCRLGRHSQIRPGVVVDAYVRIGDTCLIWDHVHLGKFGRLGNDTTVHSNVVTDADVRIGDGSIIQAGTHLTKSPFYVSADLPYVVNAYGDMVQIGCQTHTVAKWLRDITQIANDAGVYNAAVINKYRGLIKWYATTWCNDTVVSDRDIFMALYRSIPTNSQLSRDLSADDRHEVFRGIMLGESDFSVGLINEILGDYGVGWTVCKKTNK